MDSKGRLSQMNGALNNSFKVEEEGRGVVTKGVGRKGEEEMEEEEYVGGEERGEKHPKLVIQAGQCVHMPKHAPVHANVSVHMWRGCTCICAHVKKSSEFLLSCCPG